MTLQRRILIVDDDLSNLQTYEMIFRRQKFEVKTASHPQDAFQIYRTEPIDVVLCDFQMPGLSGDRLMSLCHQTNPNVPFVFLTAFGTINLAVDLLRAGAYNFLTKPVTKDKLVQAVEDAIQKQTSEQSKPKKETPGRILTEDPQFKELIQKARRAAQSESPVLLMGENGTGKELLAQMIHHESPRSTGPLIVVHCAALPESLFEAELFGVMKGAFTGAHQNKMGRIEAAHLGTLFLDEIGDIPPSTQVKLLRVLQEGTFERLGSHQTLKSNFRLISATNKNLEDSVREGRFREDLFYRIHVVSFTVPPLRERPSDILMLAQSFIEELSQKLHREPPRLTEASRRKILAHSWPGNVRELRNTLENALVFCGPQIEERHLQFKGESPQNHQTLSITLGTPLKDIEKTAILNTLRATGFNKELTAQLLGTTVRTLYRRLDEWKLESDKNANIE